MNRAWSAYFSEVLEAADKHGMLRRRGQQHPGPLIDFGSNDYLGLSTAPAVRAALAHDVEGLGWGSGASPVLNGYGEQHAALEAALAELFQVQSCILFASGYAANVGSMACLAGEQDVIYSDELNHASLIDGIRLSKAERVVFPHRDLEYLERQLRSGRQRRRRALIVSESIFSMDGDRADLKGLSRLATKYDCGLVIDEAHATGVYGATGGGLWQELMAAEPGRESLEPPLLKLGTLSKALGGVGGVAAGSELMIDFLVNRCRAYLFSTAPPARAMLATLAAVEQVRGMRDHRRRLRHVSEVLRQRLRNRGWEVPAGDSPIIPVIVGEERDALELSRQLAARQLYVPAIRPPTVPAGTSRLRISLSCRHTDAHILALLEALGSPDACGARAPGASA